MRHASRCAFAKRARSILVSGFRVEFSMAGTVVVEIEAVRLSLPAPSTILVNTIMNNGRR
jgi:hypothetical protein